MKQLLEDELENRLPDPFVGMIISEAKECKKLSVQVLSYLFSLASNSQIDRILSGLPENWLENFVKTAEDFYYIVRYLDVIQLQKILKFSTLFDEVVALKQDKMQKWNWLRLNPEIIILIFAHDTTKIWCNENFVSLFTAKQVSEHCLRAAVVSTEYAKTRDGVDALKQAVENIKVSLDLEVRKRESLIPWIERNIEEIEKDLNFDWFPDEITQPYFTP